MERESKFITGVFAGLVFEYLPMKDRLNAGAAAKSFHALTRRVPVWDRVNERNVVAYASAGFHARLFMHVFSETLTDNFTMFPRAKIISVEARGECPTRLVFNGIERLNISADLGEECTIRTSAKYVNIVAEIFPGHDFGIITLELEHADVVKVKADLVIVTGRVEKLYVSSSELTMDDCDCGELFTYGMEGVGVAAIPVDLGTFRDVLKW